MGIPVVSNFIPKNGKSFYLLEDVYIKGGLQIRNNVADRDNIPVANLKKGQLVLTVEEQTIWQVDELVQITPATPNVIPSVTWTELELGGGFPDAPNDNKTYGRENGQWIELLAPSATLARQVVVNTIEDLPASVVSSFSLNLGQSCLVLKLEVSRPVRVKAYGTPLKDEPNPYEFLATSDHLVDDGTMFLSDGTKFRSRNFSVLANMEDPVNNQIYFEIINEDGVSGPVVLTITFLTLEV